MAQRITDKAIQATVDRINRLTDSPETPYGAQGANVGNYHVSHAYGGVSLHRMVNTAGGCSDVLRCGHVPKRELYAMLHAFIAGWDARTEEHVRRDAVLGR
jgi:hypothetical protein